MSVPSTMLGTTYTSLWHCTVTIIFAKLSVTAIHRLHLITDCTQGPPSALYHLSPSHAPHKYKSYHFSCCNVNLIACLWTSLLVCFTYSFSPNNVWNAISLWVQINFRACFFVYSIYTLQCSRVITFLNSVINVERHQIFLISEFVNFFYSLAIIQTIWLIIHLFACSSVIDIKQNFDLLSLIYYLSLSFSMFIVILKPVIRSALFLINQFSPFLAVKSDYLCAVASISLVRISS